jgi:serine/threonine-protein kinase
MDRRTGPLNAGERFLKYEIRRLIGRGGHAYVYEAHDDFLNLPVAVKVIPSSADTGRDLAARARSEARVLVRLAHDNVVKVMDAGATDDGVVYLIMELLRGRDLRKTLHHYKRLTVVEVLHAARQIADGVAAAHRLGAIHRDLKPENVFIEPGNKLKVLDFGVAKVMGYGAPTTQRDLLHGTMLYMTPEQLRGAGVTVQSDIFALGTMLYEALHAHPILLFGNPRGLEELGTLIIGAVPPPLNEIDPNIPSYVARLVQRAIAKKPEQRFTDMEELSQAASDTLQRYISEARAAGHDPVLRDLSASAPPAPAVAPASHRGDTEAMSSPVFSGTGPTSPFTQVTAPLGILTNAGLAETDPQPVAETRTRPVPAAQETPPPITSTGPVQHRQGLRRHLKALWIGGSLAFGLAVGTTYEVLTAPDATPASPPPPVAAAPKPPPAPKPAPTPERAPAAAPQPPAAAPAPTPAPSATPPPPPAVTASARPAARPKPSAKKGSPPPLDDSKLPSSGLDD